MIMLAGGMMMVVCSCLIMVATLSSGEWTMIAKQVVPWIFLIGSIIYVTMQNKQKYSGNSFTIRRLKRIQLLSGILFVVAGLLMVENFMHFVMPYVANDMNGYITYMQVVHNNWVVMMLIGAVLQMFTVHRIGAELEKES